MTRVEKLAEEFATKVAGGPLRYQSWHYVKRDYLAGYRQAIEDAAKYIAHMTVKTREGPYGIPWYEADKICALLTQEVGG